MPIVLAEEVKRRGHELVMLPPPTSPLRESSSDAPAHAAWLQVDALQDVQDSLEALQADAPWDWLVVDHYGIDNRWESRMRACASRILVIDDLADRQHDCDVLLDQNFYEQADGRYAARVPERCRKLLGPSYALLRPEFADLRSAVSVREGEVRRLLVFFGGVDENNVTVCAVEAIARLPRGALEVDVVIGAGHPARREIEKRCLQLGMNCHVQTQEMARLMARADLAIGAGGTATWERCSLGLPTLALCLAENQRQLLVDGSRAGLLHAPSIWPHDVESLARQLLVLIESPGLRQLMSRCAMKHVDGQGVARVVRNMALPQITVRLATAADSQNLFNWRNHEAIRAVSRTSEPISPETHASWFSKVLSSPDRCLLIGHSGPSEVGVVRFDLQATVAEVSIYLVPGQEGRGLGAALLVAAEDWLSATHPEVESLVAEVRGDNGPSHRLFSSANYKLDITRYQKWRRSRPR
ncbi:N-acetylneuraminate cytidylyltransferase [Caldimonas brevitalea]|uniref:N-acetylneuraminate cytidylyltransferase n=1 Tax=Caldimonas brevitalea TaxID=413882 RepID=A0A0G3BBV4_9BURK|nr:N-acetylneuraminate cytidylyltransferase [Caldimonas brevitalea]